MERRNELTKIIELLKQHLSRLAEQYHVRSLGVFGSYARHQQRRSSDLDLLVTFDEPPSLLRFIQLGPELTDTLGVKVDLVMRDALKSLVSTFCVKL